MRREGSMKKCRGSNYFICGPYSRPPISKKAPGDRQFTNEEIGKTASLIMEKEAEGKVSSLPGTHLKKIVTLFRKRATIFLR